MRAKQQGCIQPLDFLPSGQVVFLLTHVRTPPQAVCGQSCFGRIVWSLIFILFSFNEVNYFHCKFVWEKQSFLFCGLDTKACYFSLCDDSMKRNEAKCPAKRGYSF